MFVRVCEAKDSSAILSQATRTPTRAGETDEEIARVTGYTVPMIRAVLRSRTRQYSPVLTKEEARHDGVSS